MTPDIPIADQRLAKLIAGFAFLVEQTRPRYFIRDGAIHELAQYAVIELTEIRKLLGGPND